MANNPRNFKTLTLKCCAHDCLFRVNVPNPNEIKDADVDLLNNLRLPEFVPNVVETATIFALLGNKDWHCPYHGQNQLAYESERLPETS